MTRVGTRCLGTSESAIEDFCVSSSRGAVNKWSVLISFVVSISRIVTVSKRRILQL